MSAAPIPTHWQDIGWNGLTFQVPRTWQPTAIYPAHLFFEHEGQPVFEIKWQKVQGNFSLQSGLKQLKKTFSKNAHLRIQDLPSSLCEHLFTDKAAGFQIEHGNALNDGMIAYCAVCKQVILAQWYFNTEENSKLLATIFSSLRDHDDSDKQLLAVYDIRAKLPSQAMLLYHELQPGKYTFRYELGSTFLTLYRFKPAAVILANQSLGEFGRGLFEQNPTSQGEKIASWNYQAKGVGRLIALLRRKPTASWMRLWHAPEQNVILGVKAEGKKLTDTGWLEKVCNNFSSIDNG